MAWTEMMKTPQFYIIWLMFVFGAGAGLMVISFMAPLAKALTDAGKIAFAGFVFVGILAVGNASGRIIAGAIKDSTGSYIMAFHVAAGICLVAAAMTFIVKPPVAEASLEKEYRIQVMEYSKNQERE